MKTLKQEYTDIKPAALIIANVPTFCSETKETSQTFTSSLKEIYEEISSLFKKYGVKTRELPEGGMRQRIS
jgi:hypothetical protein